MRVVFHFVKKMCVYIEEKNEDRENTKWNHFNQAAKLLTL